MNKKYQIKLPNKQTSTVSGRLSKIKGYSKFNFFAHKLDGQWHIREFTSGLRLCSGNTEAEAKRLSRIELSKFDNIQALIDEEEILNTGDPEECEDA